MASLMIVVSTILVLSRGHARTERERDTDADERFTPATLVGVSKSPISGYRQTDRRTDRQNSHSRYSAFQ